MPKVTKNRKEIIHPNSRKASQISREMHRSSKLDRRHQEHNLKQQIKLKKLNWFKDNLVNDQNMFNALDMKNLINKYLQRYLEQIEDENEFKNIKGRKIQNHMKIQYNQQFSTEKEMQEFKTCGLEVPNLLKKKTLDFFSSWDGDSRYLTTIEMVTLTEKKLDTLISKEQLQTENNNEKEKFAEENCEEEKIAKEICEEEKIAEEICEEEKIAKEICEEKMLEDEGIA